MGRTALYQAVWRWHFYAGLIVLPVLLWLATTGGLYLYKPEIERAVYGTWTERPYAGDPLPLAQMIQSVTLQAPGRITRIERPASETASWRMTLARADGETRTLFVDPAFGIVMGDVAEGGIMATVKNLHSLAITGPVGNTLIEIVAAWTILLCITGFTLWWPRGGQKALALRGRPRQRRFWRDFHASVGAVAGGVILFLAVTGMPWSGQWGGWLRQGVTAIGAGRPAAPVADHAAHEAALPWSMQHMAHPQGHAMGDIGPDRAVAIAAAHGLGPGWTLGLPATPGAPYLVSAPALRAEDARVLFLDPATGAVLQDAPFASFGKGAQAIEWGIAVHQGQQYGEPNRLVMLAGCIGVWLLALSAPILWWKRRRVGRLAAPPRTTDPRMVRRVALVMLALGALFPLTGATMVVALAGEWLWRRRYSATTA